MHLPPQLALRLAHGVHTASPDWFRRHVLPAFGDSWNSAENKMRKDPYEARRLSELGDDLRTSGIQRPVSVYFDHWWIRRPTVADGIHLAPKPTWCRGAGLGHSAGVGASGFASGGPANRDSCWNLRRNAGREASATPIRLGQFEGSDRYRCSSKIFKCFAAFNVTA
jgi:hypothetical protein